MHRDVLCNLIYSEFGMLFFVKFAMTHIWIRTSVPYIKQEGSWENGSHSVSVLLCNCWIDFLCVRTSHDL